MPLKSEESLTKAIRALTRELKRYNDANEPQTISREEAVFGRAKYGESKEEQESKEFLEALEKGSASR